jgi:hypothetical protein
MRRSLLFVGILALCLASNCVTSQAQTRVTLTGSRCLSCFDFKVSGSSLGLKVSPVLSSAEAFAMPTFVGRSLITVAPDSGVSDIRLVASGFTLVGLLTIQDLSVSRHGRGFDTSLMGDFDIRGSDYCAMPGAKCGSGSSSKIVLSLHSRNPWRGPLHYRFPVGLGSGSIFFPAPSVATTPEPISMLLFGTGLLVLGGTLRRRQHKNSIART